MPGTGSAPTRTGPAATSAGPRAMDLLLTQAAKAGASDVHVHSGAPILMRHNGFLMTARGAALTAEAAEKMIFEILTPEERERFIQQNDLDFAYTLANVGRYRANVYRQRRGVDAVFRAIP